MWRIPIDDLGDLGEPEVLTEPLPEDWIGALRLRFPADRVYSADGTTVLMRCSTFEGFGALCAADLANAVGMTYLSDGGHDLDLSMGLHLTPDGGEMAIDGINPIGDPNNYAYWQNLDGGGPLTMLGPPLEADRYRALSDWADDDRTGLLAVGPHGDWYEQLSVIEIGEDAVVEHPVDLQGMEFGHTYYHEGGDYLLLRPSSEDSLWGASVTASQPGPLFAIAGAAAGEDPLLEFEPDASRTFAALVWENDDLTRYCEIVSLADAAFSWTWAAGLCTSVGNPVLRGDHLYVVLTEIDNTRRVWHLDVSDPLAMLEPISAPNSGVPVVVSPNGQWVFHRSGSMWHLSGLTQPGQTEVLSFDGMNVNVPPVLIF